MKTLLQNLGELNLLKRNAKMHTNNLYLINSESICKNFYFEQKSDIEYAHNIINKHIKNIGEIIDYLITPAGWVLVMKTHSKEKMNSIFKSKEQISNTIKNALQSENYSTIISETIRIVISSITKKININNNRIGSVVKSNFSRYVFNSVESTKHVINLMKNQLIKISSHSKKYQPKHSIWKRLIGLKRNDRYISSKSQDRGSFMGYIVILDETELDHVLRDHFEKNKKTPSS